MAIASVIASVSGAMACAHMLPPPGGVADKIPPKIVAITPHDSATNVRPDAVVVEFDKVVSEQPVGATALRDLVLISPVQGAVNADWHRHAIAISPDKGWRKNTAYTIQLLAGVADLWGNVRKTDTTFIFSTGAEIPKTTVRGAVFDWEHGTPVVGAFVQAYTAKDTLFTYVAMTDSVGQFAMHALPPGTYIVRGIMDVNHNRAIDPGEAFDTVSTALRDTSRVEVLAFAHDSIGPRLSSMHVDDSVTVRITFSALLDPTFTPTASQFTIKGPDSSLVSIVHVGQKPQDTAAAVPMIDTAARNAQRRGGLPPYGAPPGTRPRDARDARAAQLDSLPRYHVTRTAQLPKPSKPSPYRDLLVTVAKPLTPKTEYTVHVTDIHGVGGTKKSSDGTFTVPAVIATPADSAAKTKTTIPGTVTPKVTPNAVPSTAAPSTTAPSTSGTPAPVSPAPKTAPDSTTTHTP